MSEDSPVDFLRQSFRDLGDQERRQHRELQVNSRRSTLGELQNIQKRAVSSEEVKALADKLKHKSQFTSQDFLGLNNALIQSEENIVAFFKVQGALHALVRELLGQNASLQLAAANCCCNLSLGNEKSCLQLTKAAAPYLLSNLDGLNHHLLEVCTWTLGNLAGCHIKPWEILHSQGLLPKLLQLITSSSSDIIHSVIYALTHYVRIGLNSDNLDLEQQRNIAVSAHNLMERDRSSCWLIYLLSCSGDSDDILLNNSVVVRSLRLLGECNANQDVLIITALVRILGNLSVNSSAAEVILKEPSIVSILCTLLTSPYAHVQRETLWLIGNLVNHPSKEIQYLVTISNIENILEPLLSVALSKVA
ncbi:importin subunit alpha-1 [Periplaneta americana]|uniref:importin subunit alpha-1 n=1 Tax=Periplaneta americana TaxID=6978 RepID=UPI0037E9B41B